jgi:exodeoxyribonuclease III
MITILNWNIVSLRAVLSKKNIINNNEKDNNTFENFVKKYNFDIICLQEIKLCKDTIHILDNILLDYPYKYYNIPHTKKGYSGVAIFSKIKPISYSTKFNEEFGRYIKVKFKTFNLINIYATNAGSKLEKLDKKDYFNSLLFSKLQRMLNKNKEIIIVGDFNAIQAEKDTYDFAKHYNKLAGVTQQEISFFNKLLTELKLYNIFREKYPNKKQYSYFTYRWKSRENNKGLLIDFGLVTKKILKKVIDIEYLNNIYGSDHIPFILKLDLNKI